MAEQATNRRTGRTLTLVRGKTQQQIKLEERERHDRLRKAAQSQGETGEK